VKSRDSKHSPEDSGSSQEASPPATPEERCWKIDMIGTFEKMKPNETGNFNNQFQNSNTGLYSYQSLIREQIRAIEVRQECLFLFLLALIITVLVNLLIN